MFTEPFQSTASQIWHYFVWFCYKQDLHTKQEQGNYSQSVYFMQYIHPSALNGVGAVSKTSLFYIFLPSPHTGTLD